MSTVKLAVKPAPIDQTISEFLIGGDVLDLITKALYVDPLCIFREYVQNSADGIQEAVKLGLLASLGEGRIDIRVDPTNRNIRISDNGVGVDAVSFETVLASVGASTKRNGNFRGFRGIGRLGGLAFCRELIFRSRRSESNPVMEMRWNGVQLKQMLAKQAPKGSLDNLIRDIVVVRELPENDWAPHFFEVELNGVGRFGSDELLSEQQIKFYLEQVACLPIDPNFKFKDEIEQFLNKWGLGDAFHIYLNGNDKSLVHSIPNRIHVGNDLYDEVLGVELLEFPGRDQTEAVGWVLRHSYLGSVPVSEPIGGLRARVGNIQVGGRELFADVFPQKRFNAWTVGEIHILGENIRPNSRRDDFESSVHYQDLLSHLVVVGRGVASSCRKQSDLRNAIKRCDTLIVSSFNVLETYWNGYLTKNQALAFLERNRQYLNRTFVCLNGSIKEEYGAKLEELDREIKSRFRRNPPKSRIDQLSSQKRNFIRRVAEAVNSESQNPDLATRVIKKLLDDFGKQ